MRNIVVLLFDQASILTLTGVLEPFALIGEVDQPDIRNPYTIWLVSREGGPVKTLIGHSMDTLSIHDIRDMPIDTLMIPGGFGTQLAIYDEDLITWISDRAGSIRRICSLGTGVWIAAETGLLDHRRVVVHWRLLDDFTRQYPNVCSEAGSLFLQDGPIWSSPGLAGAIDLSLALIEEDLGRGCALILARLLVVFMKRPGGQPQLSAALCSQAEGSDRFDGLHSWIMANLHRDLSVDQLADVARMSVRNFTRVYQATTGTTPAKAVEALRLEAVGRALLETNARISDIAQRYGFGDEERMRRAFMRKFGVGPSAYRLQRRTGGPTALGREAVANEHVGPRLVMERERLGNQPDSVPLSRINAPEPRGTALRLKPFRQRAQFLLELGNERPSARFSPEKH